MNCPCKIVRQAAGCTGVMTGIGRMYAMTSHLRLHIATKCGLRISSLIGQITAVPWRWCLLDEYGRPSLAIQVERHHHRRWGLEGSRAGHDRLWSTWLIFVLTLVLNLLSLRLPSKWASYWGPLNYRHLNLTKMWIYSSLWTRILLSWQVWGGLFDPRIKAGIGLPPFSGFFIWWKMSMWSQCILCDTFKDTLCFRCVFVIWRPIYKYMLNLLRQNGIITI
jgi:hypothetical protein